MNIITKIECGKRNKDRVNIYIDEEYAFSVDMEIVYKEGLKVKDSVDYDKLKKVIEEDKWVLGWISLWGKRSCRRMGWTYW